MSGSDVAGQCEEAVATPVMSDGKDAAVTKPDGRPAGPSNPLNQQFSTLNGLRRERTWVDVYLVTGTCLHGQIRSFDSNMLLLQTRSGDVALYHHAVSSVMRAQKRGASSAGKGGGTRKPARGRGSSAGGTVGEASHAPPGRGWRHQPATTVSARPRVEINRAAGGRIEGTRPSGSPRAGGAVRQPESPPAGVVVVRHKRVRTIVKPED